MYAPVLASQFALSYVLPEGDKTKIFPCSCCLQKNKTKGAAIQCPYGLRALLCIV